MRLGRTVGKILVLFAPGSAASKSINLSKYPRLSKLFNTAEARGSSKVSIEKGIGEKIGYGKKREGGISVENPFEISKSTLKHINNRHNVALFKKQVVFMTDAQLKGTLKNRSFFNPNWSEETIDKFVAEAYRKLSLDGKRGGNFRYNIDGEDIVVVIKSNGELDTAYGLHKFSIEYFK